MLKASKCGERYQISERAWIAVQSAG